MVEKNILKTLWSWKITSFQSLIPTFVKEIKIMLIGIRRESKIVNIDFNIEICSILETFLTTKTKINNIVKIIKSIIKASVIGLIHINQIF